VIHTLRGSDGLVQGGVVDFDVAARFTSATTITGLTINGFVPPDQIGPPAISSGITPAAPLATQTGFGHISRFVTVSAFAGLEVLNNVLVGPDGYFGVISTTASSNGAISAPLSFPPSMDVPTVNAVISAVSDPSLTTLARGGLGTAYGTNVAKISGDFAGFEGSRVPAILNGVAVSIAGLRVPVLVVSPGHVVFQVPFEVPIGRQSLMVFNGNGGSREFMVNIAAVAPALYFGPDGAVATHLDYLLVGSTNAAQANELIWFFGTGFGPTAGGSPLATGIIPSYTPGTTTATVAATVGGRSADVVASIPSPGYLGLYQILVRVPAGLSPGNQTVTLTVGGTSSNAASIVVR